jgi:hypothetical protein
MARKFVVSIDLNRNELINAKIHNLPAAPTLYTLGQIYYNTTDNKMYYYNGLEAPNGPWMPMSGSEEVIQDVIYSTLQEGEGIDLSYNDPAGTLTISVEDASTSNKGAASFNSDDFNVNTGHVELEDTVVKSVTTDSGALTPSSHGISILGGEGIDVTHTGTSITVAGEDASTTNKGVASFATEDFNVTTGAVSIKNVNLGSQTTGNYVATIAGTENEITVSGSGSETAAVTIGLPDNVTITNNLNVGGDLNVSGSINSVNTTQVNISDNYINLNSDMPEENTPSVDAGIKVHRGIEADVDIKWNETSNEWQLTNDGSNYYGITRKFSSVLSTSATTYMITHNLNTRDVVVQIYETGSPYAQIEADVEHTNLNEITIKFAVAPSAGEYRVVVTG